MARPRTIDPDGRTKDVNVVLARDTYEVLSSMAADRGISLGAVVRETIAAGLDRQGETAA